MCVRARLCRASPWLCVRAGGRARGVHPRACVRVQPCPVLTCGCVPCRCGCAGGACGCASTSGCVTRLYLMVHPHVLVRSRAAVLSVHVSVWLCTRVLVLHGCVWLCTSVRLLHAHVQSLLRLCHSSVCSCASACGTRVPTCSPVCSCTCRCACKRAAARDPACTRCAWSCIPVWVCPVWVCTHVQSSRIHAWVRLCTHGHLHTHVQVCLAVVLVCGCASACGCVHRVRVCICCTRVWQRTRWCVVVPRVILHEAVGPCARACA